jgi:hypothetical protein
MRPNKKWHFLLITLLAVAVSIPFFAFAINLLVSLYIAIAEALIGFGFIWYYGTVVEEDPIAAAEEHVPISMRSAPIFDGLTEEDFEVNRKPRLIAKRSWLLPHEKLIRVARVHPITLAPIILSTIMIVIGGGCMGFIWFGGGLKPKSAATTSTIRIVHKRPEATRHKKHKVDHRPIGFNTGGLESGSSSSTGLSVKPLPLVVFVLGAGLFMLGLVVFQRTGYPQAKDRWWTVWILTDKRFFKAVLPPSWMPVGDSLPRTRGRRLQGPDVERSWIDKQIRIGNVVLELAGRDEDVRLGPIRDPFGWAQDVDELIDVLET